MFINTISSLREEPTSFIKILQQYANRLRSKRFTLLHELLETLPQPVNILDVGGAEDFWENVNFTDPNQVNVTLLNISETPVKYSNFKSIVGDATNLECFADNQFDLVFSNSVIEHVGDYQQQKKMAEEIRRVSKRFFVQTPNYYFPIEPHFLFPCFQFLPLAIKVWLIQNFELGWYKRVPDKKEAIEVANSVHLLKEKDLRNLFGNARLYKEKFFGFTKSLIAYNYSQEN